MLGAILLVVLNLQEQSPRFRNKNWRWYQARLRGQQVLQLCHAYTRNRLVALDISVQIIGAKTRCRLTDRYRPTTGWSRMTKGHVAQLFALSRLCKLGWIIVPRLKKAAMQWKSAADPRSVGWRNQIGALTPFIERPRTTGDHL